MNRTALPSPNHFYRQSGWWLFGYCVRHPILAIAVFRRTHPTKPLTNQQKTLFWVALLHGIAATLLT